MRGFDDILGRTEYACSSDRVWLDFEALVARPAWMRDALCREYPASWWFPGRGQILEMQAAKNVCSRCLVASECAAYAAQTDVELHGWLAGVWAGESRSARNKTRKTAA